MSAYPLQDMLRVRQHREDEAERVGDDVTLASLDLLARVEALLATLRRRLDRLRVEHGRGRCAIEQYRGQG